MLLTQYYNALVIQWMPDIRTPVIRTITRFTESFVSYSIEFLPDIRTFHAGYKNMPDIRTIFRKRFSYITVYFMPVIRTCSYIRYQLFSLHIKMLDNLYSLLKLIYIRILVRTLQIECLDYNYVQSCSLYVLLQWMPVIRTCRI